MTKLLTTTAMLLAFAGSAAAVRADTLPKEILGKWCQQTQGEYNGSYKRGDCGRDGRITVKPNSVEYEESGCDFISVNTRIQRWYAYNDGGVLKQPAATPWMWRVSYEEREDSGLEPTREAAMQAFARSWHREM